MTESLVYKVVVADDVAALRNLLRLVLEGSGRFRVIAEASTGLEAVRACRQNEPDLVLLDLSMPEMDGLEALPRVLEAAPRARVAVLSGFNHVRMEPIARRLGAAAYLEKGLAPAELVNALLATVEPTGATESRVPRAIAQSELPPAKSLLPRPDLRVPGKTPTATPAELVRNVKVLLVEDVSGDASTIRQALSNTGRINFQIEVAGTLQAAKECLAREQYDAVLLDLFLPDSAGMETIMEILAQTPEVPVVVITGVLDEDLAAAALKLGVEDYLTKAQLDGRVLARSLLYAVERRASNTARSAARHQAAEVSRLRELERVKTQFLNTAAHELNTPLTPIKVQLHLLKTSQLIESNPSERRSVEILERNLDRLGRLVQDLLEVARLQAGRMSLQRERVDLCNLMKDIMDSFEPLAMAQGIRLDVHAPEALVVNADAKRVTQVLFNLVSNALKFTQSGGHVNVEATRSDKEATILVHDDGAGLAPEQIARLFMPFSQVHDAAISGYGGSGLGLFVCKGLVELHGGRIWCESAGPKKGATFAFTIPFAEAKPRPEPPVLETNRLSDPAFAPEAPLSA